MGDWRLRGAAVCILRAYLSLPFQARPVCAHLMLQRYIYPKIAQTYHARISLRSHRSALLERMTRSLEELKEKQHATFAALPQPAPFRELAKYAGCHGLDQLAIAAGDLQDVPPITMLRCAIEDCSKAEQKATSAELFHALEVKFPWVAEEGSQHEVRSFCISSRRNQCRCFSPGDSLAHTYNNANISTRRVYTAIKHTLSLHASHCPNTLSGHRLDIHPTHTHTRTTPPHLPRHPEDRTAPAFVHAAQIPTHLPSALRPHRLHHDTDLRAPDRLPRARAWLGGAARARGGRGPAGHPRPQGPCPQPALLHASVAEARVRERD